MIQRVLVPLDGSTTGEAILPELWPLADRCDPEIILVRAQHLISLDPVAGVGGFLPAGRSDYLPGVMHRLAQRGARVRIVERIGPPVSTILDLVAEEGVSLVAMATHGRKGIMRVLLGSVTEQVLRSCPVPVLAVRAGAMEGAPHVHSGRHFRNILVPLDGTEDSAAVLPQALEVARLFGSSLILLRALDPARASLPRPRAGDGMNEVSEWFSDRDLAADRLREIFDRVLSEDVHAEMILEEGDPLKTILGACGPRAVDLIAMSTRGRSGLRHLIGGSLTEKVLHEAPVPMLIARCVKSERKGTSTLEGRTGASA